MSGEHIHLLTHLFPWIFNSYLKSDCIIYLLHLKTASHLIHLSVTLFFNKHLDGAYNVPDTISSDLLSINSLNTHNNSVRSVLSLPILSMGRQKHRELKRLVLYFTVSGSSKVRTEHVDCTVHAL